MSMKLARPAEYKQGGHVYIKHRLAAILYGHMFVLMRAGAIWLLVNVCSSMEGETKQTCFTVHAASQ